MSSANPRQEIDDLIAEGRLETAFARLKQFYASSPTLANAQFVLTRLPKLAESTSRVSVKVAFLRSFTIEPVVPLLRASAALYGVDMTAKVGDFNTYAQDLLTPSGFLAELDPGIVVLAAQTRDVLPGVWRSAGPVDDLQKEVDDQLSALQSYLSAFRSRSSASLIVHNLEQPERTASGVLDSGQARLIECYNDGLREIAARMIGTYVLDYDALVARHGRVRWHDEQKWLTMRMPISAECLPLLADEYLRYILPLTGKVCKVLVCDLDNTLWGGVIGEDGMPGIALDAEYPGAGYVALQQAILDLYDRGVILAIASKNNPSDALEAIDAHPNMLLRSKHFAAMRINWSDKAQNLREIAKELNIGIDSLAFIDDNPVERQRIQAEIPEVCVVDLPDDPLRYASALRSCPVFERLSLSAEDKERGRYYTEQRQRAELEQTAGSLEDFYRSLEQVVAVDLADDTSLARAAQLTQKTNQFNLTTRRYSEQEVADRIARPDTEVLCVRVQDKFGDNGIVGIAILRFDEAARECELDTLLLSCRVIGRTVETAILSALMQIARARGSQTLWGWFLPTAKNAPAAQFYAQHGFAPSPRDDGQPVADDAVAWSYDLTGALVERPEWIQLVFDQRLAAANEKKGQAALERL